MSRVAKKIKERERKRKKEALCWVLEGRLMSVRDWGKGPAKQRSGEVTPGEEWGVRGEGRKVIWEGAGRGEGGCYTAGFEVGV